MVFAFLLCPETGGKTLEQVDYFFVEKGFAGLRKNFNVGAEALDKWKEKVGAETQEDAEEKK